MKAITPVIAIILLLLITISIAGFAMVFFQRTAETATRTGDEQLQQQLVQFTSQPLIDAVSRNRVYVRNAGSSELGNLAFFVNNVAVGHAGPATLSPGAIGTYYLNDAQLAMLQDRSLTIKVASGGFSDTLRNQCLYCNDMAGYWKFDESSGNTAADSSMNSNSATINGAGWSAGKHGNALSFDGSDDFVNFPSGVPATLQVGGPITIEAWIKTTKQDHSDAGIVSYGGIGFNADLVLHFSTLYFYMRKGGSNNDLTYSTTMLYDDQWHHVAATWDGTTNPSGMKLYIDGALLAQKTSITSATGTFPGFQIGKATTFFNGQIDEVRILKVARTMTTS